MKRVVFAWRGRFVVRLFLPGVFVIDTLTDQPEPSAPNRHQRPAPHPVYWVIAAALVVIATTLVVRPSGPGGFSFSDPAFAQTVSSGGARGIFAFSGQLSKGSYGVYMVDVDAMTMWVYEYLPQKGCMRLAAARTWRYDRYLENHNLCDLPPDVVEQMIEDQRRYRLETSEAQMPPD